MNCKPGKLGWKVSNRAGAGSLDFNRWMRFGDSKIKEIVSKQYSSHSRRRLPRMYLDHQWRPDWQPCGKIAGKDMSIYCLGGLQQPVYHVSQSVIANPRSLFEFASLVVDGCAQQWVIEWNQISIKSLKSISFDV